MPNTGPDAPGRLPRRMAVQVAVAAIFDEAGRVLIARRPEHLHQGGLWEFPGGKVEANESVFEALVRELDEELGIAVQAARPLIRVRHDYPELSVVLDVWRVDGFSDTAVLQADTGREGQVIKWVRPEALPEYDFPAANRPIITAVRLPDRYLITPDPGENMPAFLAQLENRLREGVRLVQLRAKSLSTEAYAVLARQCVTLCEQYAARLLLNADPQLVMQVGAHGVHLDSERLASLTEPPFLSQVPELGGAGNSNVKWVSASCHSEQQLEQARRLGADFVVLSPVAATASHPGAQPLGWARFQQLTALAGCPVYALGGMTPADRQQAFAQGAQGVAAIRALWKFSAEC
ncbi:MAG: Nudix family hydrolase [Gammaproteobacteria bacterium]|nr:Nudix family hydrolase [Gammaproteobacteria bacterium]